MHAPKVRYPATAVLVYAAAEIIIAAVTTVVNRGMLLFFNSW